MSQASQEIARQYANAAVNKKNWGAMAYNVLSEGLSGDGATDDTAKLQALINKAIAEGRKTLHFPHGSYYVTFLTNADKVDFVGDNSKFVGGYSGTIGNLGGLAAFKAETEQQITDLDTTKADKTEVNQLANDKANQTDLDATNATLGTKANQTYVDTQLSNIGSGSPKGTYATLTSLQTAYPSGTTGVYIVSGDGKWYYWNGGAWTAGGVYQSTGIADNGIDTTKYADGSVVPTKTSFASTGKNLFNYNARTIGYYLNENEGSLIALASKDTSDYIPVKAGMMYTSKCRKVVVFDLNKNFVIGYDVFPDAPKTITPAQDGYIRVSFDILYVATAQVEIGSVITSYEPYHIMIRSLNLPDSSITPVKTSFTSFGKNMFNYATRTVGYYIIEDGTFIALASKDTSDFIPVKSGVAYTINKCRKICFFDINKVSITGQFLDVSPDALRTIIPAQDGYIRVSFDILYVATAQVEIGSVATAHEQYGIKLSYNLLLPDNSIKRANLDQSVRTSLDLVTNNLSVTKIGERFDISSPFDSTKDIVIQTNRTSSLNGSFNFIKTTLVDKGFDPSLGEVVHSNSDDITPIRTFATVGANHGYPNIVIITMAGHDKTTADLGSRWTDGVRTYTLLDISSNNLTFGCPYTVTNGIVSSTHVDPIANLTHVSGATHTNTVNVATKIAGSQLYPSINNVSCKFVLDGTEITADGTYYGKELQVQESYNVMDYKDIIDYSQANIGISYKNDSIGGTARLSINYSFKEKGALTISHNFRALRKLSILNCGFIQSAPISLSGHKTYRYMPNVLPKGGVDFKGGSVDLSTYNQSFVFGPADYINPSIPPNRHVDWLKNATTGVKKIGFTMGYVVDKSNSKNADRLTNSPNGWDMRDTSKSYPIAMSGLTLNPGEYKNFICYRNYISPHWEPNALNFVLVRDKKDVYVYLDYNTSVSFQTVKLDQFIGCSIVVVDKSSDFILHNDMVDADGILLSVSNNYGYAILKLN